jgi:hypothetical protein
MGSSTLYRYAVALFSLAWCGFLLSRPTPQHLDAAFALFLGVPLWVGQRSFETGSDAMTNSEAGSECTVQR